MNKKELLEEIRTGRRQLERYLFYFEKGEDGAFIASDRLKFGVDELLLPGVIGDWSLRDLLCHIIDWERRFLSWYETGRQWKMPAVPPADMSWEELDPAGYDVPTAQHGRPSETVVAEFRDSFREVLSLVAAVPEDELFTPGHYGWTGKAALADYVALVTYRHYEWAKEHIRRWRKSHAGRYLNKQVILERITAERRRLEKSLALLDEEQMVISGVVGEWSVKDVLAHLMDWEGRFLGWYEAGRRGEVPEVPAPGIGWDKLDSLNQRIYEKYREWALASVLAAFQGSYQQVLRVVERIPEEEMFAAGGYAWLGEGNMVGYILANTADHYRWAKLNIRRWLTEQ